MSVYVLTPLAKADIFDNEDAADRVERAIYEACALVAEAPSAAIPVPTLHPIRSFLGADPLPKSQLCTGQRWPRLRSLPLCMEREISGGF